MRLLNLKTPVLALICAIIALVLSGVLSCVQLLDHFFVLFYYPAEMLAILCMPGSFNPYDGGLETILYFSVICALALLQWYLICFAHIYIFRHSARKSA